MDTDKKRRSNWIPWIIVIFAIIAFGVVFGFYWAHFGWIKEIKTNDSGGTENALWGVLGDYVGGTLNPLLSFLALCALLWTIRLQIEELETSRIEFKKTAEAAQEQVNHFKSESQRTDLYRIIEKLAGRIEEHFGVEPLPVVMVGIHTRKNYSIREMINNPSLLARFIMQLKDEYNSSTPIIQTKTYQTIQLIELDLKRLANYIKQYQATNPLIKTPIHDFYREEFGDLVRGLYKLELIKDEEIYSFYAIELKLGKLNDSGLPPK